MDDNFQPDGTINNSKKILKILFVFLSIPDYDYLSVFLNHLMLYPNDVGDVFDDEMEVDGYYPFQ
jgi:hypothetical protein